MEYSSDSMKLIIDNGAICQLEATDKENFLGQPVAVWEITLRHRNGKKVVFNSQACPQTANSENSVSWNIPIDDTRTFLVCVTGNLAESNLATLKISVSALPSDWTVFRVIFPCFDWKLEDSDSYRMVIPQDRGLELVNPLVNLPDKSELWTRRKFRERKYPNCFITMQCFGLISGSNLLYFAAHDPAPVVKNIYLEPDAEHGVIHFRPSIWTGLRYGEDYQSFPWAFGIGTGNWFDVAQFYRKFALTASWTQGGPLEESDKTPRWYQDTPIVMLKDYRGELYDADAFVKVAEYLKVPLVLHYYMWHKPAFDTDYPFLFPTIPGFREEMRKLQAAGVRVMPYLNAYSADTGMDCWQDVEHMAIRKNEELELHAQVWSQNRALAAMCPAHPFWKRILNLISARCVEMCVDGIYFDEIGCSPAHNCYAENHHHIPGDENAFIAGHRQVMREMREEAKTINPDIILTTESCSEAYMDVLDGFLIGNGNDNNEVPLFEAVYHDYTMGFGQYVFSGELDDSRFQDAIIGKCARQFIFGAQFGWTRIPMLAIIERRPDCAAFIKTLAHAKHKHSDFLTRGKMLRPLELDVPMTTQRWLKAWNDKTGEEITLPAVLNSVWIRNDTTIGVVLVNITREPVKVNVDLVSHADDYPLPQGGIVRVWEHHEAECRALLGDGDSDCFTVTVPPLSCVVASIGSEKPFGVHSF